MKVTDNYVFFWGDYPFSNFSETPIVLEDFIMVDGIGQEKRSSIAYFRTLFYVKKGIIF